MNFKINRFSLVSLLYYTHSLLQSALGSNVGRDGVGNDFCVYEKALWICTFLYSSVIFLKYFCSAEKSDEAIKRPIYTISML